MLLIRIDLVPLGQHAASREIARAFIGNDGTGDSETANYDVVLRSNGGSMDLRAHVEGIARDPDVWVFLLDVLAQTFGPTDGVAP